MVVDVLVVALGLFIPWGRRKSAIVRAGESERSYGSAGSGK
jgi:hypothetical protein